MFNKTYYKVHVHCINCDWDTRKVENLSNKNLAVEIPIRILTEEFLKTHKCILCGCMGTCESVGWSY